MKKNKLFIGALALVMSVVTACSSKTQNTITTSQDKDTFIYKQTFNFEDNKLISINKPEIIPCSISSEGNVNNYQPTPLNGTESDRVKNKLKNISEGLNK